MSKPFVPCRRLVLPTPWGTGVMEVRKVSRYWRREEFQTRPRMARRAQSGGEAASGGRFGRAFRGNCLGRKRVEQSVREVCSTAASEEERGKSVQPADIGT